VQDKVDAPVAQTTFLAFCQKQEFASKTTADLISAILAVPDDELKALGERWKTLLSAKDEQSDAEFRLHNALHKFFESHDVFRGNKKRMQAAIAELVDEEEFGVKKLSDLADLTPEDIQDSEAFNKLEARRFIAAVKSSKSQLWSE
jgi:hypothetical protein